MNERYYDRCGDCGRYIKQREVSKWHKVCDECWERRGWFVAHINEIITLIGLLKFQKLQRDMAYHSGTAKRQIIKLQKEMDCLGNR